MAESGYGQPMDAGAIDDTIARSGVPARAHAGWKALLELDATLGNIVRHTREPMVGQMRLTWWHAALGELDEKPPPAQPVLQALAADVLPVGVTGVELAALVEGWEMLLEPDLDAAVLTRFAEDRGGRLFRLLATILTGECKQRRSVVSAGEGWALADLVPRLTDAAASGVARTLAEQRFTDAFAERWPLRQRALGVMALVAQARLDNHAATAAPKLALRLIRHRLTGK